MNYIKLTHNIDQYIKNNLSNKRYNHSVKVAEMSVTIAEKLSLDIEKSYLAGLAHDIARELSKEQLEKKVLSCVKFSADFYLKPMLFHGPVGADLLCKKFGIDDVDIIEAVTYHSIGSKTLGSIAKVIYVADYISYDRTHIDEQYRIKILSFKLDEMVLEVINSCRLYLESNGEYLLSETENMYNSIIRKLCEKEKGI